MELCSSFCSIDGRLKVGHAQAMLDGIGAGSVFSIKGPAEHRTVGLFLAIYQP